MAEELSQQTLMLIGKAPSTERISQIGSLSNILSVNDTNKDDTSESLNQDLQNSGDFSDTFNHSHHSVMHENIQHLTDHSYIHSASTNNSVSDDVIENQDVDSVDSNIMVEPETAESINMQSVQTNNNITVAADDVQQNSFPPTDSRKVCLSSDILSLSCVGENSSVDVFTDSPIVNNDIQVLSENTVSFANSLEQSSTPTASDTQTNSNDKEIRTLPENSGSVSTPQYLIKQTSAPLGSVDNPIQIIQQGNSYRSTQVLTQAQLQQITHVLQRQHAKKVIQNGGRSILYDPSTNTRIVCRVVHPSELQSKVSDLNVYAGIPPRSQTSNRGRGRPKRPANKRFEEDEKGNSLLSREEREEKKKHRPRTRSGRISKPPSYMVKDYKRIHHLDFNEEAYDDSDGGYSDYHVSDEEGGNRGNKSSSLPPGVTTAKQRNYSCSSCSKAYIGRGGLSRHYRLNPSHGSMPDGEDVSTQDENSNSSLASSILSSSGGNTSVQNNSSLFPNVSSRLESDGPSLLQTSVTVSPSLSKRRLKLQEVLKGFSDEELLEELLPKFSESVSLWDFFLMKCEKKPDGLNLFGMLREFEIFLAEMQRISMICLAPATLGEDPRKTIINISSKQIAAALSLETGSYSVKNTLRMSEAKRATDKVFMSLGENLADGLEKSDDISPLKRKRIDPNVEDITPGLPEQILSDTVNETDNLELHLPEENFPRNSEFQKRQNFLLSAALCRDNSNVISSKHIFDLNSSTTVTPSSMSSGCLSAINSSENQPVNTFLTDTGSPLQNMQVRKIQFGCEQTQQLLSVSDPSVAVSSFSVNTNSILSELPSQTQVMSKETDIQQVQMEVCDSNVTPKNVFQGLPADTNMDIFNTCQELTSQTVILDNPQTSELIVSNAALANVNSIHNGNVPINSRSLTLRTGTPDIIISSMSASASSSLQNSSSIISGTEMSAVVSSEGRLTSSAEERQSFEATASDIASESSKSMESSTVLRHVMLPDGQLIGIWSHLGNSDKPPNEQLVQGYMPGNLIILQNSDGSVQVPSDQGISLETLQALASADSGISNQNETQIFTTVQHI
ncbi:uncharacterized protein LOC129224336 [Uloborus diversus]|uniref:uncharacterized protein LOC129224336 n=1 Tax=Uloborus diversus TaxID=327109 RepID=UPI00240A3B64|nr:uncharacterized protein LOC129224336 [Uloborus diversus]